VNRDIQIEKWSADRLVPVSELPGGMAGGGPCGKARWGRSSFAAISIATSGNRAYSLNAAIKPHRGQRQTC
jgi:hypothetical protein